MTEDTSARAASAATLAHPNVQKVISVLEAAGHSTDITVLPERAHTAALAAQAQGVDVGAIANSLIFTLDGEPVLILTSGAHRVDTAMVGARLGGTIERASAHMVRDATGQPIGGVAPVGHPRTVRTFVDRALAQYPEVWAAAGHPNTVFSTNYEHLLRLTGGQAIEVSL